MFAKVKLNIFNKCSAKAPKYYVQNKNKCKEKAIFSTGSIPTEVTTKGSFLAQKSYVLSGATLMNCWQRDSRTLETYRPQRTRREFKVTGDWKNVRRNIVYACHVLIQVSVNVHPSSRETG